MMDTKEHVKTLRRREEWIRQKLKETEKPDKPYHWLRAELSSTVFCIEVLEKGLNAAEPSIKRLCDRIYELKLEVTEATMRFNKLAELFREVQARRKKPQ